MDKQMAGNAQHQNTESFTFSRKKLNSSPAIMMEDTPIQKVKSHKHLGITLQKIENGQSRSKT